jgi:DNA-binding MarR family transcriptional regulator
LLEDRRGVRLQVTATGRKVLKVAEAEMAGALAPVLEHLADREAVFSALDQLGVALDQVAAEREARACRS